jgi:hypothetical protein
MDRIIVLNDEQINASDTGNTNSFAMIGIAKLASAVLGGNTLINDLMCIPDSPLSLNVILNQGEIYQLDEIDDTPYGALPINSNQILKTGISFSPKIISISPPATPGDSINYLIQVQLENNDNTPENRPFFGGVPQVENTIRSCLINAALKAGLPAPTGTQITPTPDAGFIGAWVVTVANGQTTIGSGNITVYDINNFITETLIQKISQESADARYAQIGILQSGGYVYSQDTGVVNALVASLNPNITSLYEGMEIRIKVANTNTGASTINPNGLGVKNIKNSSGFSLTQANLITGMIAILYYDGAEFILSNPANPSIAFRAIFQGVQTPTPMIDEKVQFSSLTLDKNSDFDTAQYRFTCQIGGTYEFSACVAAFGNFLSIATKIFLDGVSASEGIIGIPANGIVVQSQCCLKVELMPSQYVEVFVNVDTGATILNDPLTYFECTRLF